MTSQRKLLLSALIAAGLGLANAAQATTAVLYYDTTIQAEQATFSTGTVTATGGPETGSTTDATTGNYTIYNASNSWNSFIAYCFQPLLSLDISMGASSKNHPNPDIFNGGAPNQGITYTSSDTLTLGGVALDSSTTPNSVVSNIQKLFNADYLDSLTSSVKAAGFQLALWTLENNPASFGYSGSTNTLTSDNFTAANVVNTKSGGATGADAVAIATGYLNTFQTATPTGTYRLQQWIADANGYASQSLISADLYVPPPVPEPMTLSLVALGLAGVAASRGRKLH